MAAMATLEELELGQRLGRGATAEVVLGRLRREPTRRFALKVVEKAKIPGRQSLERLYREKDLLSSLANPGIVKFYHTLKDEQRLYFVLEYLDGGELLWHMRRASRNRIPADSGRICLAALLLALVYLQENGVLYRDIKPTNIVFTRAGRLKLVDFGHAKRMGRDERSTSVCGTPHFHAPEVVRGEPHGLAAQLWALGVLMIEMLAGQAPFRDRTSGPTLQDQILHAEVDFLFVPEAARPLAASLLQRDVAQRDISFPGGFCDVMKNAWFGEVDWQAVEAGSCVPSFDFVLHAEEQLEGSDMKPTRTNDFAEDTANPFSDFDS